MSKRLSASGISTAKGEPFPKSKASTDRHHAVKCDGIVKALAFILLATLLMSALLTVFVTAAPAEKEKTVVRVGWFPYPGSSEVRNGQYYGYNYDYLMEIAKYTGWEYEFVEADFAACATMLRNGEIDLFCGLQYSSERAAIFDFPDTAYGETYSVLYTSKDSPLQPYDYESFDGIKVGIMKGTLNNQYFADFAADNKFSYTMKEYATSDEMNAAIETGEIDAAIITAAELDAKTLAKFAPNPLYIVTTKGNSEILVSLNWALRAIKTARPSFMYELYQKFYADSTDLVLTQEERDVISASQNTPVTVGVIDNNPPVSFFNKSTETYDGIIVDMLALISEKTGLRFNFVPVDLSRRETATTPDEDSPQLVLGALKPETLPDTRGWYLSDSLFSDSLAVIGRQGHNLAEKTGAKTVAVMSGFGMASEYAQLNMPGFTVAEYQTLQDCLDAVADGRADAAVYLDSCLRYILQKPYYEKLEIIPTYSENVGVCAAGFTEEAEVYIGIIDKGLRMVTEDESRNIILNCTMGNPYKPTLGDTLYKYFAPLTVIACLVISVIILFAALYFRKRKSDKLIKAALAEAKQAGAAKGNFMSRMSHEIRTPLNAVIGYNTIARNELTEAKTDAERRASEMKVMDCLTKSDIASRHLLTIINDVLDISAIESGKINVVSERFDFKGLISSLTAIFYSQAKSKDVDFDVLFDEQMDEWIVGDQMRLNQILTNLLSNAIKFTPDGGRVTLIIRPQTEPDTVKLHFEVSDTGIGMSEDYLDRIWTPFEQADSTISRRFGGTGLGLSITKTLVDLLGGTISVKSVAGQGSTFIVDLSVARTEQPEENGLYDFSTINALIVDDDSSTCDYIRLLLTRSGVRSAAVNSGAEAINAVKTAIDGNTPYTVCLVDWRMPKMDGLETVRQIRSIAGDNLPIIVITAYDFTEIADKAAAVGVNRFISKPLFQSSLFNLLANISGSPTPRDTERLTTYDFNGARVLLAEDNTMNMEIARRILESAKLTVDSAWNGQEAVDTFLASPDGTYNAIFMDVQMPVMDGYKATRAIRASGHPQASTIPIIAMTADAFAENVAESHAAGMNDHISKPIDISALFRSLNKFIH